MTTDAEENKRGVQWLSLAFGLAGAAAIMFATAIQQMGFSPASSTLYTLMVLGGIWPLSGLVWFVIWPQILWPDRKEQSLGRMIAMMTTVGLIALAWAVHKDYLLASLALVVPICTMVALVVNWQPRSDAWALWAWRIFFMVPALIALFCCLWLGMPWPKPVAEVRQMMAGDFWGGLRGVGKWILRYVFHFDVM